MKPVNTNKASKRGEDRGGADSVHVPTFETIEAAIYCKQDPAPTPPHFQDPELDYCNHDQLEGNCRQTKCKHYAPCPHLPILDINPRSKAKETQL